MYVYVPFHIHVYTILVLNIYYIVLTGRNVVFHNMWSSMFYLLYYCFTIMHQHQVKTFIKWGRTDRPHNWPGLWKWPALPFF